MIDTIHYGVKVLVERLNSFYLQQREMPDVLQVNEKVKINYMKNIPRTGYIFGKHFQS